MNLIEALRTKRPLRRPIAKHIGSHGNGYLSNRYVLDLLTKLIISDILNEEDILADDWEVQEVKVTITLKQFIDAYDRAFEDNNLEIPHWSQIATQLGLLEDNLFSTLFHNKN